MTKRIHRVVFVGLGQMGRALVSHLVGDDLSVTGVDISAEACAAVSDLHIVTHTSTERLEDWGDCVLCCLPYPEDVMRVATSCAALSPGSRPQYFINLSTIGPRMTSSVDALLRSLSPSVAYLECPVTGGVLRAQKRQATILCGFGSRTEADAALPILSRMATEVILVEGTVQASIAKLVNNIAAVGTAMATLEALHFGLRSGLDLEGLFEVMGKGTARSYVLESTLRRPLLEGDFRTGFALRLAAKDMRLALDHAEATGCAMPLTRLAFWRLEEGIRAGLEAFTFPSVAAVMGIVDRERVEGSKVEA